MTFSVEQENILFQIKMVCSSLSFCSSLLTFLYSMWVSKIKQTTVVSPKRPTRSVSDLATSEPSRNLKRCSCSESTWCYPIRLSSSKTSSISHISFLADEANYFPWGVYIGRSTGSRDGKWEFYKENDLTITLYYNGTHWVLNNPSAPDGGNETWTQSKSSGYYPFLTDMSVWRSENVKGGTTNNTDVYVYETQLARTILRTLAVKLVRWIVGSHIPLHLGRLYGNPSSNHLFQLQSFQINTFGLSSIFWVASLTKVINYVRLGTTFDGDRYIRMCHKIIWPSAFITSALPFMTDSYSPAKDNDSGTKVWLIAVFYGELALVFGYIVYVYFRMYLFLASGVRIKEEVKFFLANVVYFPPVLVVTHFFGLVRHIFEVTGSATPYWLAVLDVVFSSLLGFVHAVLFAFVTSGLRKDLLGTPPSFDSRPGSSLVSRLGRSDENEIDGNKKNHEVEMHTTSHLEVL